MEKISKTIKIMVSPETTNSITRSILKNEIAEYIELQNLFTKLKIEMVETRKAINCKLTEITRLQNLPKR